MVLRKKATNRFSSSWFLLSILRRCSRCLDFFFTTADVLAVQERSSVKCVPRNLKEDTCWTQSLLMFSGAGSPLRLLKSITISFVLLVLSSWFFFLPLRHIELNYNVTTLKEKQSNLCNGFISTSYWSCCWQTNMSEVSNYFIDTTKMTSAKLVHCSRAPQWWWWVEQHCLSLSPPRLILLARGFDQTPSLLSPLGHHCIDWKIVFVTEKKNTF